MLNTVQDVFDIAVRLMDEQNESTGNTDTADTKSYAVRTPSLLNSILDLVYPASDTYQVSETGRRSVCPKVSRMEDTLDLDERICTGVLPWGLAGLLSDESSPRGSFFWETFLEHLADAESRIPADAAPIDDVYGGFGGIEYGRFSQW